MQRMQLLLSLAISVLLLCRASDGGRVLVFPGEYSHWLNMKSIMEELVRRNHSVTVLVPAASPSINYNSSREAAKFSFLVFEVPFSRVQFHGIFQEFIHFSMYESHLLSPLQRFWWTCDWMQRMADFWRLQCDSMLKNERLMRTLRDTKFDVVLLDPMVVCGDLVADVLGLPFILSLRFSFGNVLERHCGHASAPPSYVPAVPLPYSDRMTFMERLINSVMYVGTSLVSEVVWKLTLDRYYSEIKGSPSGVCESLGKAKIWLIRTFWDLETPRPIPPNFQYVGGLHCKPAAKLPEELEAFVQSSGEAGVVVVTFGSMVTNLTTERANVIAAALGRIPQKVIWKYSGEAPATVAANTKLSDWIPQNDLLGHPKTRAFVTHGGTNGLYEAVYHGVPLVGIPLFGDQSDNLSRLSRRGAAIVLDFNHLTVDELTEALQAISNQPTYRSRMQHLSALHHDRPESPLSTALFWVEFVMRNGKADHLRLASRDLNWFQYHSLDTVSVLVAVLMAGSAICWSVIHHLLQICQQPGRRGKTD
ncbi:UDP-glucuronosyltransferase 2A1-like [Betta splendens]|uniref:UDP-glucuronosyltransferase n=1 Tax=Betta splendens TaxID=158456 RepID=A0A6P7NZA9_BETSP|nr:UDP-glucuronosyltransferase 2A1-like [Betta splendens]